MTRIPKFQCFIQYIPLFHPCFWFVLYKSALSCVFLGFFRVLSGKYVILCLFSCTHDTLYFHSNSQRNTLNNGSKDQNICVLVEYVTVWTNLSTGGGTKRQQSFLFLRGMKCIGFFWPINVVKMWWRNHVLYGFSEYPNETSPDNLCFTTLLKVFR